ncbi:hypothetical protein L6P55_23820 [Klebsiella pneumoniae]|nr:hypothetical protein [Klebsiella pneumoniae]
MKVRYLMSLAALEIDPEGRLTVLAKAAGVNYDTLLWNIRNTVSAQMAETICDVASTSGIRPHWLTNPDWVRFNDESGEILE